MADPILAVLTEPREDTGGRTIWKFALTVTDEQTVMMPRGAEILSVNVQRGELVMWALVFPDAPLEPRRISVRGTGHPAQGVESAGFIGTVLMADGALVFHVFGRRL